MNYKRRTDENEWIPIPEQWLTTYHGDEWDDLAQAIIVQAAEDYRKTLKWLKKYPKNRRLLQSKRECESFFRSDWFTVLTNADPERILDRIRKEMDI